MIITYVDGSGNAFVISGTRQKVVEYTPVKPEVSSSGVYDGGTYTKKKIDETLFSQIRTCITDAIHNPSIQIKNRVMGSGLIIMKDRGVAISCILQPGSPEQRKIETLLKEIIA
jgi:hypothetical protein